MSSSLNVSSATSLGAANMVTQNYAALNSSVQSVGVDPSAATVTTQDQAAIAAQFSMGVLKMSLDLQATAGAQLVQAMTSGSGVDLQA